MKQLKKQYKNGNAVHSGQSKKQHAAKLVLMQFHVGLKMKTYLKKEGYVCSSPLSLNKIIQPKIFYYTVAMQFTPNKITDILYYALEKCSSFALVKKNRKGRRK